MAIDYDEPISKIEGMKIGVITNRDDPEGFGRVRVRIPGLIDSPGSNWAWPLGCSGGGSNDEGFYNVPPLNAEVAVWFKDGHPDHPYYLPANWGLGEVPDATENGDPDIKVIAMKEYDVIIDTRDGTKNLKITDKQSSSDYIEFNGTDRSVKISSTSSVEITSIGEVKINGLIVSINGVPAGFGRL